MAQCSLSARISKRWFFWPAVAIIIVLGTLGIIKDMDRAGKWLADHAMRLEVV